MAVSVLPSLVFLSCVAVTIGQDCPPEGVSYQPLPDCSKYIVCDNGHPFEMDCPPNLYYNTAIEQCDFPENVPECVGGTREPIGVSTTTPIPSSSSQPPTNATTTTETPSPSSTSPPPNPSILKNCGDTAVGNSGRIEYKVGEPYGNNEICSFILQIPDYNGILFTLDSHGLNASELNPINIFTFTNEGLLETAHLGPPNPLTEVYVSGSLAVVVFRTQQRTGYGATGFQLSYEGIGGTGLVTGDQEVFSVLEGEREQLYVPTQAADTARGTLNAYVMTRNHKVSGLGLKISNADLYTCGDVMQCACDSIRVFSFLSERVDEEVLFCDERYHRTTFASSGLFIVILNVFDDAYPRNATLTWGSST